MTENQWLTVAEVAHELRLDVHEVREHLANPDPIRGLHGHEVAGQVLVEQDELDRFIDARTFRYTGPGDPRLARLREEWDAEEGD